MCREVLSKVKKLSKFTVMGLLAIFLSVIFPGIAMAELPAPTWMPGFPMLAGPQLMMMWQPVAGAMKYKVIVNGSVATETQVFQHFMPSPTDAGEYRVTVVAVDSSGKDGAPAREWVTKIFKLIPPREIYERTIGNNVSLRWDPVPSAMIYNVYKRVGKEKEHKLVASVQDTAYTESNVPNDLAIFFSISAKDASGKESDRSKEKPVMIKTVVVDKVKFQNLIPITSKIVATMRGGALPDGKMIFIKNPGGSAEAEGKIFISDITLGRILVFERDSGEFRGIIGKQGNNEGEINRPIGISVDRHGNLLVCDAFKARIVRLRPDGSFVDEFKLPNYLDEAKKIDLAAGPVDIRQLSTGEFVVVDNGNSRIMLLDAKGNFIKNISFKDAKGPVGFARPSSISVDSKDRLYIADAMNGRILVSEKDGKVINSIGQPGDIVGEFGGLLGVVVLEKKGWVVGVDSKYSNLQIFDISTGKYLYSVAGEKKDAALSLSIPQRATLLSNGAIAVSEALVDRDGGGLKIISINEPESR